MWAAAATAATAATAAGLDSGDRGVWLFLYDVWMYNRCPCLVCLQQFGRAVPPVSYVPGERFQALGQTRWQNAG